MSCCAGASVGSCSTKASRDGAGVGRAGAAEGASEGGLLGGGDVAASVGWVGLAGGGSGGWAGSSWKMTTGLRSTWVMAWAVVMTLGVLTDPGAHLAMEVKGEGFE